MVYRIMLLLVLAYVPLTVTSQTLETTGHPPIPVGGYEALAANVAYPETAQMAGVEGTVIVKAFVNRLGQVDQAVILQGVPHSGFDEAALAGISKTRFTPAHQNGVTLGVWIAIPVIFRK